MSFPRYPKYKPSGVEWLGDVPEGWEVRKLSFSAVVLAGHSFDASLFGGEGIPVIRMSDFGGGRVRLTEAKRVEVANIPEKSLARKGDILLGLSGSISNFAEVVECDLPIAINQRVAIVRIRDDKRHLVKWFLQSPDFLNQIVAELPETTIQNVSMGQLKRCKIPLPPLPERTAIAEFLDRETAKIDGLVAEQQLLMELLKEKRQAVISHAVTKGLNPHAPMKPSGIEWLGDVPAGWVIGKLGYACKLRGGFAFAAADFGTEGVAVVKMNNLKRGRLDLTEAARIPESSCNGTVALLEGDLVWGMSGSTGETGSLGNFARVVADDLPCQLNQRVGRFQVDSSKLDLNFVEQVIQSPYFYEQIMLLVTGTAQYNVSSEQVQSCIFALPPLSEQTTIAEFLKTETAKFESLTAEAQRAIDLLQERRTALISAAVTGQIDVRNHLRN
jgi:type I restriction enzyme S subunit